MKKCLVFIVSLCFVFCCTLVFAIDNTTYSVGEFVQRNGIAYDKNLNTPITGIVRIYYKTGELKGENPFHKGRAHGVEKTYYKSGRVKSEMPYSNGIGLGLRQTYYESGQLSTETPYTNSRPNGIGKIYYESGKLSVEIKYKNSVAISGYYYKNGSDKFKLTDADLRKINNRN